MFMNLQCIDHGCKGDKGGYARAWLTLNGKRICTFKHRRIYFELTGQLPEVVRHKCDNPRCINPDHLEGGTQQDNMNDMKERGQVAPQDNTHNLMCKFSDAVVAAIRSEYVPYSTHASGRALARKYGMSFQQVSAIVTNKQRGVKHV